MIPLFAQLLLSGKWSHLWFVITVISLGAMFALDKFGFEFPVVAQMTEQDHYIQWLMAIIGCSLSIYVTAVIFRAGHISSMYDVQVSREKAELISKDLAMSLSKAAR